MTTMGIPNKNKPTKKKKGKATNRELKLNVYEDVVVVVEKSKHKPSDENGPCLLAELIARIHHVIRNTAHIRVHFAERRTIAICRIMHPHYNGLGGLVYDDTLR